MANFVGRARVVRDNSRHCGLILGAGSDRVGGSRAAGEVEYALEASGPDETHVTLIIRALLARALAQFGRTGIVEGLAAQIVETFARNIESKSYGLGKPFAARQLAGRWLAILVGSKNARTQNSWQTVRKLENLKKRNSAKF